MPFNLMLKYEAIHFVNFDKVARESRPLTYKDVGKILKT